MGHFFPSQQRYPVVVASSQASGDTTETPFLGCKLQEEKVLLPILHHSCLTTSPFASLASCKVFLSFFPAGDGWVSPARHHPTVRCGSGSLSAADGGLMAVRELLRGFAHPGTHAGVGNTGTSSFRVRPTLPERRADDD